MSFGLRSMTDRAPEAIVRSKTVRRIGFTGNAAVGCSIERLAASVCAKMITPQLGGTNAHFAFPDAFPTDTAKAAIRADRERLHPGRQRGTSRRPAPSDRLRVDQRRRATLPGLATTAGKADRPGRRRGGADLPGFIRSASGFSPGGEANLVAATRSVAGSCPAEPDGVFPRPWRGASRGLSRRSRAMLTRAGSAVRCTA